jgi:hypothetical protein
LNQVGQLAQVAISLRPVVYRDFPAP